MLQQIGDRQSDQKTWRDFILEKARFHAATPVRMRTDAGFPWSQIDVPLPEVLPAAPPGLIDRLTGRPAAPRPGEVERGATEAELRRIQDRHIRNFERNAEKSYAVRALFEDDLSRMIFDETIVLRLAGHRHVIGPRVHFDRVLTPLCQTPFEHKDFPNSYLGTPLVEMTVEMQSGNHSIRINLVVPEGFETSFNTWRQYFQTRGEADFVPKEGDVIFDCGACIGDMSAVYSGLASSSGHVYAFDPIPLHTRFCALQAALNPEGVAPITPVNFAVGNETCELPPGEVEDINTVSPGGLQIDRFNITRLDDFVAREGLTRVNFIKMDIEGAEPDALEGAANLLRTHKPKLAISTYHRPDQFWSIPLQIKKLNPEYRLFFGHHSPVRWESVVYAY
ncbi:MAG: FkbM family methyltransferase [Alphaproteobacteria bacterium]|nr:FkbM family methyltransferase [Alphaproteobacteria bacterium]